MRLVLLSFILLLFTWSAWCGELSLLAPRVHNGEVAVLRWQGEPLSFGVVRFRNDVFHLYPDPAGAVALLPVGLDVPAGAYLLRAALADLQGRTTEAELVLRVDYMPRPEEHLSLPERMVTPDAQSVARINRESNLLNEKFALRSPRLWTGFERPVSEPVSSVFGKRRVLNGKPKSPHSGTDFRSPSGTPVRSISNGVVSLVGDLFYTGKTVVVDHGEGLSSLYAHLSKVLVEEGQEILTGDALGEVGSTGRSTGAHLHLTVRLLGERIDPLALLDVFAVE
ncbi:MAG: M23 family metallopeptidase [Desulfuromonadales bacterium]|nr:M23 family metallopeptidase [Desulfuromonadales bacterium]